MVFRILIVRNFDLPFIFGKSCATISLKMHFQKGLPQMEEQKKKKQGSPLQGRTSFSFYALSSGYSFNFHLACDEDFIITIIIIFGKSFIVNSFLALWPLAVGRDPIFYYLWGFFVPLDYIDIISSEVLSSGTKVYHHRRPCSSANVSQLKWKSILRNAG